jgi:hypothetical protein
VDAEPVRELRAKTTSSRVERAKNDQREAKRGL